MYKKYFYLTIKLCRDFYSIIFIRCSFPFYASKSMLTLILLAV